LFSLLQFKYVLLNASIPEVYYTIISRVWQFYQSGEALKPTKGPNR
jgi:hypothetical protein